MSMGLWIRAVLPVALLGGVAGGAETVFFDGFEVGSVCAWSVSAGSTPCCGALILEESFGAGEDAPDWPPAWTASGAQVALADLFQGRGRMRPADSGYSLARMAAAGTGIDVEALFSLEFEELSTQGIGFYVRQNGGYLTQTSPSGQGYAVFIEGFRGAGIGVWREVDGAEIPVEIVFDEALGLADATTFRVRFRVTQLDASTTALAARIWPAGSPEPTSWQVESTDSTAALQNLAGGFAIDSWSSRTSPPIDAHTLVDDLQVFALCPELP